VRRAWWEECLPIQAAFLPEVPESHHDASVLHQRWPGTKTGRGCHWPSLASTGSKHRTAVPRNRQRFPNSKSARATQRSCAVCQWAVGAGAESSGDPISHQSRITPQTPDGNSVDRGSWTRKGTSARMPHGENFLRRMPIPPFHCTFHASMQGRFVDADHWTCLPGQDTSPSQACLPFLPPVAQDQQDARKGGKRQLTAWLPLADPSERRTGPWNQPEQGICSLALISWPAQLSRVILPCLDSDVLASLE
jgi:hypothetical protein